MDKIQDDRVSSPMNGNPVKGWGIRREKFTSPGNFRFRDNRRVRRVVKEKDRYRNTIFGLSLLATENINRITVRGTYCLKAH